VAIEVVERQKLTPATRRTAAGDGRTGRAAVRGAAGGRCAAAGALPPRGLSPRPHRRLRLSPGPSALTVAVSPLPQPSCWLRHLASVHAICCGRMWFLIDSMCLVRITSGCLDCGGKVSRVER
jgi:hypothetical protein